MKKIALILCSLAVVFMVGCTNPKEAKRVLESQGYTKIEMTGYQFFSCGKDDFYHTGFKAVGMNGAEVEGTVCSGFLFKGATVRFD